MKRVAVLGATGFAGKAVCEELEKGSYYVGRFSYSRGCDLLNIGQARRKIKDFAPEFIVNCAARVGSLRYVSEYAGDVIYENMLMALNLYRIVQKMAETVIINPIANCAYPGELAVLEEEKFWNGEIHPSVMPYGATRRLMVSAARAYYNQYGVRSINLVTPNMYGPGDSVDPWRTHALNALVIKLVRAVKEGKEQIEVWGSGKPVREWLYVKDFARLVRMAIEKGDAPVELVNLAQYRGYTVMEISEMIAEMCDYRGVIFYNHDKPDGAASKIMYDREFRKRFAGFEFTPIREGIGATIEYYRGML